MRDYYAILRIARTATNSEIKAAYRQIALAVHPDVNKVWHGEQSNCGKYAKNARKMYFSDWAALVYSSTQVLQKGSNLQQYVCLRGYL